MLSSSRELLGAAWKQIQVNDRFKFVAAPVQMAVGLFTVGCPVEPRHSELLIALQPNR